MAFEAYGRDVCAYIYTGSAETRAKIEAELPGSGFDINAQYGSGSGTIEVTNISYFKAYGWNA